MRQSALPTWAVVAVWTAIGLGIGIAAARQRKQRRETRQPYSIKDTLLLVFAGALVAAMLLYLVLTESVLLNSRPAGLAIVIGVSAVLTYVLNRKRTQG